MLVFVLFLIVCLGMGFSIAASYFVTTRMAAYYRILSYAKEKHANDLKTKYGIEPLDDALYKYDPALGTSNKFLLPGFIEWRFWTGSRPSWVWEFMASDENFGDATLQALRTKYRSLSWKRFSIAGIALSLMFFVSFAILIAR